MYLENHISQQNIQCCDLLLIAMAMIIPPIPPKEDPKAKKRFIGCLYCLSVPKPNTMRLAIILRTKTYFFYYENLTCVIAF
jgi:hypothetical protein